MVLPPRAVRPLLEQRGAEQAWGQAEGATMSGHERRIVVGVDGSDASKAALRWAIRQAKLTGGPVDAVTVWRSPSAHGWAPGPDKMPDLEGAAKRTLIAALAEVSGLEPGVLVCPVVTEGDVAGALLHAAEGADLLVVGSRGHGGLAATLLGSVSMRCVLHAPCPVLVLRDGRDGKDALDEGRP
jgi:nucleotide-binding universal stress UspA family protein